MRSRSTGSITKRSDLPQRSRFWVQVRSRDENGNPTRVTLGYYPTRASATEALEDYQRRTGGRADQHSLSIHQYAPMWIASLRLSPNTIAGYERQLRLHVVPYLGTIAMNRLDEHRLNQHYRDLLASGLSPASVRRIHQVISSMYSSAIRHGGIAVSANPAQSPLCSPPTERDIQRSRSEITVWTPQQLDVFLAYCYDNLSAMWALAWTIAARTGVRLSELMGLRFGDHDPTSMTLRIRRAIIQTNKTGETSRFRVVPTTKSGKPRTVDLDPQTNELISAYRSQVIEINPQLGAPEAHIIVWPQGAEYAKPRNASTSFQRFMKNRFHVDHPEIPIIRLHDLRHTHASHLLAAGVPVNLVAARLGHESAMTTMKVYAHLMPGAGRGLVDSYLSFVDDARAREPQDGAGHTLS